MLANENRNNGRNHKGKPVYKMQEDADRGYDEYR
jgi:hypothetical protein